MIDFLQMPNKLFSKKIKKKNKSKQKANIKETSLKATISILESSDKKELPVHIPVTKTLKSKAKNINIAMISADVYCIACYLKKTSIFAISMRNIKYQAKKENKAKTNLKSIVPSKYYNFLDVFSKKNTDTFPQYQKYDHKIQFKKKQKFNHVSLYKMFFKKLDVVKLYFNSHLAKKFS